MSPNTDKMVKDLKSADIDQLTELASGLRKRIIEVVAKKGGHLASSLGAVEICIALQKALDTPRDKIVFDVGHQAYAHKLLTGRYDSFEKIRELGGISGFPYHKESAHDVFSVGHASNAVSLALGLACANKLLKEDSKVVAVIGDGSLTGGECFEGLNSAGHRKEDLLVIFNHNEMSISPSVGAISNYLNKLISLPIYNRMRKGLELVLEKVPKIGKQMPSRLRKIEEIMKGMMVPGIFFEELGFRYFGPLDGHNLEVLISTLKNIIDLPGPKVLHVITKKGKGYVPAQENPEKFHGAPPFLKDNGKDLRQKDVSYTSVFSKKIKELGEKEDKLVALTAAMCGGTGLEEFASAFSQRFFDVGIAEQHLVSFAAGLSKKGLKPVVAVYSTFLQRAYDQLIEDVALQELPVIFAVDRAGIVGQDGPTHHGVFDINYTRSIPNFVILAPGHKNDLENSLSFALKLNKPVIIRYPKEKAFELEDNTEIRLGKSQQIREGTDCAVLALGSMLKPAIEVAKILEGEGLQIKLINPRFVKPLDEDLLLEIAETLPKIVTIEEGLIEAGFGSSVMEFYQKKGLLNKLSIKVLGLPSEFITFGKRQRLLDIYGLTTEGLYKEIKSFIKANG